MESLPEHTRRHDERTRAGTATSLVDAGDRAQTPTAERRLEGQATLAPGHADPPRTDPVHPAWMSGEETVPIRPNGRMIAWTFPMMFSPGIVPWNSSPMWNRESAELPRLSPITQ